MEISVKITGIIEKPHDSCLGFCSLAFDDELVVNNVAIINGKNGIFASMPQKAYKKNDGTVSYSSIVYPKTSELKNAINDEVIKAYNEAKNSNN